MWALGKPTEALASCEKARALREALVATNPSLAAYRSDLAVTLGFLGVLKKSYAGASVKFAPVTLPAAEEPVVMP